MGGSLLFMMLTGFTFPLLSFNTSAAIVSDEMHMDFSWDFKSGARPLQQHRAYLT